MSHPRTHSPEVDAFAVRLRKQGLTYTAIGQRLGISSPKAWILCNRSRHYKNMNERRQRWLARGKVALIALPPSH